MNSNGFDPHAFTRIPNAPLPELLAAARALIAALPSDASEPAKVAAAKLAALSEAANSAYGERQAPAPATNGREARAVDLEADRAWAALRDRLLSYAHLPSTQFPNAERSELLLERLFPDQRIGFVNESYAKQWAQMDAILKRIQTENLSAEIEELAGPDFLLAVRNIHGEYETMVSRLHHKPETSGPDLRASRIGVRVAIQTYALRWVGGLDLDDAAAIKKAEAALSPILQLRARLRRRNRPGRPEVGVDALEQGSDHIDD